MLFPQIRTQGVLQEAAARQVSVSRSGNRLHDGSRIQGAKVRPLVRCWRLRYAGLTAEEAEALRHLVVESRSAAGGFVFIDPWANMLARSEDLTDGVWQPSALCEVSRENALDEGIAVHSVRSLSGVAERIEQVVALGGAGTFCLSCDVRSETAAVGAVRLQGGSQVFSRTFAAGPAWRSVWVTGEFSSACAELLVSIEVGGGSVVMVRGVELDYQGTPCPYKPSHGAGGVYPDARVVEEEFIQTLRGQDWIDCQLEVRVD